MPVSACQAEDLWCWHPNKNGKLSVKSAYHTILTGCSHHFNFQFSPPSGSSPNPVWKKISKLQVPPRFKLFAWRCSSEALSTVYLLAKHHITSSDLCSFCSSAEDANYVFLFCQFADMVWKCAGLSEVVLQFSQSSFSAWYQDVILHSPPEIGNLFVVLSCLIWYHRNKRKFEGAPLDPISAIMTANSIMKDFNFAACRPEVLSAAQDRCCGIGVAVFDANGQFIEGLSKKIGGIVDPEVAECLALKEALHFAAKLSIGPISIFGDATQVVLAANEQTLSSSRQGEGEAVNEQDSEIVLKKHRISTSTDNKNTGETNSSGTSNLGVGNSNIKGSGSCGEPTITEMAFDDGKPRDIDEDLHSRSLQCMGERQCGGFLRPMFSSKNLILAGVKSVTLHDEGTVELWDMSSNFVFSEKDLGKNRALASIQKLQELNNAVAISTLTTKLNKEQLSDFQAVVFTDINLESAIEFNEYCHNHEPPIAFIKTEVRGLFGSAFCDFGPEFTVFDVDGEEPHTGIIASISNDNPALVACVDDERLEFQDGDLVVFSEIRGMTELNDGKPRKIKNARPYSFTLDEDTTTFGMYERGGIVTQVKQPKVLNFKPLKEAIKDPGDFLLSDFSKFDRPPLLHLAFQSLDKFVFELGRFPVAGSEEDAQRLISITSDINESLGDAKLDDINPKLLRHFAFGARAVLNPMAAMFGGIVGQEVVKACSGKFHPLFQFFYFDSVESLPTELLDPSDFRPLNSRYDAQISVFGSKLQKKLEDAKVFVVGSGALGCEFLKNLALMGVSCGKHGKLTITDDDVIEKSNLSRQFLFRDWNIGQPKSTVAASAASSINPLFHIEALQNRVGPETENVFSDTFWENLNVVVNALDNVNARLYVDQRCMYFQKPLLESGTLGAKCNTQMVIPHLTENYGASRDPPEKQAPMCTVHSFPHNIDHCLTWARSEFEGLLEKTPAEANAYLSNPNEYASAMRKAGDAQARDNLERVIECLDRERCESFQDCITWARLKFEDYFANRVKQLTFTFPEDAATSTGAPFWSAPKRFPRPLQFSVTDPSHLHFIMAASILRAETFGISVPDWAKHPKKLAEAVDKVILPDFQPKKM
ncbi:hypothetical protein DH2020_044113 [Rehmannia glutinosa]|uniref:E1 ubiquitin-activating enzyme n=1 Tax=Rehmannia glutinosa TaxID=99300 RepID=A0ABR0UIL4_REHGL